MAEWVVGARGVMGRRWVVLNGQLQWPGCVLDHAVDLEPRPRPHVSPSGAGSTCTVLESYLLSCDVPDRNAINFQYPVPDVHGETRVTTKGVRVQPARQF